MLLASPDGAQLLCALFSAIADLQKATLDAYANCHNAINLFHQYHNP